MALTLALAGCVVSAPPADPAGPAASLEPLFAWTSCEGFEATVQGPTVGYPDASPAGWPPPQPWPMTASHLLLLRCQRIGWDGLERPAAVLLEWRGDAEPPPACNEPAEGLLLVSLWSGDEALVAQAKERGMPARQGAFAQGQDPASGDTTWTWGPPGEEPSTVTLAPAAAAPQVQRSLEMRFLWAEGEGLGSLDLRGQLEGDTRLAWGALRAPMLHGRVNPVPDFATVEAGARRSASAEGLLQHYGDTRCEQPL